MRERPKIPFRDTLCLYFHGTLLNDWQLAACLCISVEGANRGKAGKPTGKGQVFLETCRISTMSGSVEGFVWILRGSVAITHGR